MNLRKLKIIIEHEKTYHKRMRNNLKKIDSGKMNSFDEDLLSFQSLDQFRKFITPKRIELLRVIRKDKPDSVYELAKIVKRKTENVNRDLNELGLMGFVELKKEKKIRTKLKPKIDYESIEIKIPIEAK